MSQKIARAVTPVSTGTNVGPSHRERRRAEVDPQRVHRVAVGDVDDHVHRDRVHADDEEREGERASSRAGRSPQYQPARNSAAQPALKTAHDGVQMRLTSGHTPATCSSRPSDDAGGAPRGEPPRRRRHPRRGREQPAGQQAEDHRRQRRHEVQREVAAAVEAERRLAREQVEEPHVGGVRRGWCSCPSARRSPVSVVRPVGRHADRRPVEARRRQRIQRERRPVADQDRRRRDRLPARARPGQQEQERVAQADLRQHVLEGEVGLRPPLRAQEDAEQRSGAASARTRVAEQPPKAWPRSRAAGDRERQRHADHEHERRLDQVPRRDADPLAMLEHVGDEERDAVARVGRAAARAAGARSRTPSAAS